MIKKNLLPADKRIKSGILAFLAGLVFTLISIEIVLRILGFAYLAKQEIDNKRGLKKGTIKILCLGESTTMMGESNAYPAQLQKILDENSKNIKFKVINGGVAGIETSGIIANLKNNINKYNPDIVIGMMGINDSENTLVYKEGLPDKMKLFLANIRAVKIFKLFYANLLHHARMVYAGYLTLNKINFVAVNDTFERSLLTEIISNPKKAEYFIELSGYYAAKKDMIKEEVILRYALIVNPKKDWPYDLLGEFYLKNAQTEKAREVYDLALKRNPSKKWAYRIYGEFSEAIKDFDKAEEMYKKSIDAVKEGDNNSGQKLVLADFYLRRNNFTRARDIYLSLTEGSIVSDLDEVYLGLNAAYKALGDVSAADEIKLKLQGLYAKNKSDRPYQFYAPTKYNYLKMAEILSERKIKLISMQYPMRSVLPLKELLKEKDILAFVDNEDIFKKAVEKESFSDIFEDKFGGDFGHCSPLGNKILATNAAEVILRVVR